MSKRRCFVKFSIATAALCRRSRSATATDNLTDSHELALLRPTVSNPVPMLGTAVAFCGQLAANGVLVQPERSHTMIAHASQFRRPSQQRLSSFRVRYDAPADLLPWADPYITSLFAEEGRPQAEIDTVLEDGDDELN